MPSLDATERKDHAPPVYASENCDVATEPSGPTRRICLAPLACTAGGFPVKHGTSMKLPSAELVAKPSCTNCADVQKSEHVEGSANDESFVPVDGDSSSRKREQP